MADDSTGSVAPATLGDKAVILACAALAYATRFQPSDLIHGIGQHALGDPPYRGFVGMFLPHLLLYSTLTAAACAVLWLLLARFKRLPPIPLGRGCATLRWAIAGGLSALGLTLAVVAAMSPPGTIHWIGLNGWSVAGNLFSNFFEEFIYRGFLLTALTAVFGFWPAAVVSSALWGFGHQQYPYWLQTLIAVVGVSWCWIARRARTLWAPYGAHMLLDTVADCLVG